MDVDTVMLALMVVKRCDVVELCLARRPAYQPRLILLAVPQAFYSGPWEDSARVWRSHAWERRAADGFLV